MGDAPKLVGLWRPKGYLRHVYGCTPLLMDAWIPVTVPSSISYSYAVHPAEIGDMRHVIRADWPLPDYPAESAPKPEWDRHFEAMAAWEARPVLDSHAFRGTQVGLALNPICPVCGASLTDRDALTDWDLGAYRRVVADWSYKAMRTYVERRWSTRGREGIHLDHIVPIAVGVAEGIDEMVMASPVNLQQIPTVENLRKHVTPGMATAELVERYRRWSAENPEWEAMIMHRRMVGTWPRDPNRKTPRRYADDDERNAAHRTRMAPVYALYAQGVGVPDIAIALGISESTLKGRIQLDKRYFGESSPFARPR